MEQTKEYRCRLAKADKIYAFKSNTEVAFECITFDNDSIYLSTQDAISFAIEILETVDAKPTLSQDTINNLHHLIAYALADRSFISDAINLKQAQQEFTKVFGSFKELENG